LLLRPSPLTLRWSRVRCLTVAPRVYGAAETRVAFGRKA
jgi:hypothetical protein